ncbi:MAG: adenylyl-sulfate kinase [Candidatus Altiarchaeales archaeon ex4484_96]|nr:MAG: adenylyl-sulfate kinase [Candidatus Altiarchaeales archaeon ex4484_96]
MAQKGFTLWFTGLSGSGKSTIADIVAEKLTGDGYRVERLDGDEVRQHLTRDLGFTKEDREENIRRISFVAKLLSRNNVIVITSFISPYIKMRNEARDEIGAQRFVEVYVKCPLEVCKKRDVKGLYAKALKGEIDNFTGVSHPYEEPSNPEVTVETHREGPSESADRVVGGLKKLRLI